MPTLILIVVLFVFAWFFLVLPSRRRQRAHAGDAGRRSRSATRSSPRAGSTAIVREEGDEERPARDRARRRRHARPARDRGRRRGRAGDEDEDDDRTS